VRKPSYLLYLRRAAWHGGLATLMRSRAQPRAIWRRFVRQMCDNPSAGHADAARRSSSSPVLSASTSGRSSTARRSS